MAFHYAGGDRDQLFLLPVSMRDWLDEGHLAWFVIDVVERIDTSAFHARYRLDGPGRPPYDPEMMLALLFYAYAIGMQSSRRIEAACRTDAAFRVIAGGATPDHATIARFVVEHQAALGEVFFEVLRLCALAGLVSPTSVAIDGTKVGADAAIDQNRSAEWIRAQAARMVEEAIATDVAEDAHIGVLGFEELPADLASPRGRRARIEAALAEVEAQEKAERAEAEARAAKARGAAERGAKLRGPKPSDPQAAVVQAEAELAVARQRAEAKAAEREALEQQAQAGGHKPRGRRPAPDTSVEQATAALEKARAAAAEAPARESVVVNVVDPDSRIMKTKDGFIQGYNCQAAVSENQVVIACGLTQETGDVGQYEAMVTAARAALDRIGVHDPIGLVLADAGYCSEANLTVEGPPRLIATQKDWKQRRAARQLGTTTGPPPAGASPIEAMEHRLRTPEGAPTRPAATASNRSSPTTSRTRACDASVAGACLRSEPNGR